MTSFREEIEKCKLKGKDGMCDLITKWAEEERIEKEELSRRVKNILRSEGDAERVERDYRGLLIERIEGYTGTLVGANILPTESLEKLFHHIYSRYHDAVACRMELGKESHSGEREKLEDDLISLRLQEKDVYYRKSRGSINEKELNTVLDRIEEKRRNTKEMLRELKG